MTIAQHGVRRTDDFVIVGGEYRFAAKAFRHADNGRRKLMIDIMKMNNIRPLAQQKRVELRAGLGIINKVHPGFDFAHQAVAVVVIDVMDEKFLPRRRFIFRVQHAEVDHLVAGLQHRVALLKINGFRAAFDKEEFVNEENFHFQYQYAVDSRRSPPGVSSDRALN